MNTATRRLLEWVFSAQPLFDFRRSSRKVTQLRLLKPFSELVLTLSLLKAKGGNPARIDVVLEACWSSMGRGRYVWQLLWARPEFVELLGIIASFSRAGYNFIDLNSLKKMFEVRKGWGVNLPPWRRMAVFHALDALGLQEFPEAALHGSFLADQPQPWTLSDDLLYGLTHEIFYVTDFGAKPWRLPASSLDYVRFSVSLWLDVVALQQNWDLLAELIISCYCVGMDVSPCLPRLLRRNMELDGSIKGPRGAGRDIPARNSAERQFANSYHTTLVTLMALSKVGQNLRSVGSALPNP